MYNTMLSTQHLKGMGDWTDDPFGSITGFISDVVGQAGEQLKEDLPEALKKEAISTMFPKQFRPPTSPATPSQPPRQPPPPQADQPMTVSIPAGATTPSGYVNVGGTGIKTNVLLLGGAAVAALLLIILLKK